MNASICYYTCNTHKPEIDEACRQQLLKSNLQIVSVSLNKSLGFGDKEIVVHGERSPLMMHTQVLTGLLESTAENIFLCEADVLYHPSHFDFTPLETGVVYYNTNVWKVRYTDGLAVWTDDLQQVSGICAKRELLLRFFSDRINQIEKEGFNKHYEPNSRYGYLTENWLSEFPNVDIRHDKNITSSKWSINDFRNQKYAKGWKEAFEIPGWGETEKILQSMR